MDYCPLVGVKHRNKQPQCTQGQWATMNKVPNHHWQATQMDNPLIYPVWRLAPGWGVHVEMGMHGKPFGIEVGDWGGGSGPPWQAKFFSFGVASQQIIPNTNTKIYPWVGLLIEVWCAPKRGPRMLIRPAKGGYKNISDIWGNFLFRIFCQRYWVGKIWFRGWSNLLHGDQRARYQAKIVETLIFLWI